MKSRGCCFDDHAKKLRRSASGSTTRAAGRYANRPRICVRFLPAPGNAAEARRICFFAAMIPSPPYPLMAPMRPASGLFSARDARTRVRGSGMTASMMRIGVAPVRIDGNSSPLPDLELLPLAQNADLIFVHARPLPGSPGEISTPLASDKSSRSKLVRFFMAELGVHG